MKCKACFSENIHGSKTCKACGASLVHTESGAASPVAAPASAPKPLQTVLKTLEKDSASASKTKELSFIPYTGNAQFNHFIRGLRFALDFKGRTGRADFWYFTLFQALILIVLEIVFPMLVDLALGVTLVPTLAIWFRRLHDTDRSGQWLLVGLIPVVNLVLIYFAVQAGNPEDNHWGPGAMTQA